MSIDINGMNFNIWQNVEGFYMEYRRHTSFGVSTQNSSKSAKGNLIMLRWGVFIEKLSLFFLY